MHEGELSEIPHKGGEKEKRGGEETKFFKKGVANWVKVWVS